MSVSVAEGADLGVEGAAEVGEGAGEVKAVRGGRGGRAVGAMLAAGSGGPVMWRPPNSAQASTAAGKTAWRWPAGEVWSRRVSAQYLGLFDVPAPGLPAGGAQCGVDGYGEAGGRQVRSVVHPPCFVRGVVGGYRGGSAVRSAAGSTVRTPKWAVRAVQARQGGGVAAVQGVAVLADVAGGEFGVFEGACGPRRWSWVCGRRVCCGRRRRRRCAGRCRMASAQRPVKRSRWALVRVSRKSWTRGCRAGGWSPRAAVPVRVAPRTERAAAMVGRMPSRRCRRAGAWAAFRWRSSRRGGRRSDAGVGVCPVCVTFMIVLPSRASPGWSTDCQMRRGWWGSWGAAARRCRVGGRHGGSDGWSRNGGGGRYPCPVGGTA